MIDSFEKDLIIGVMTRAVQDFVGDAKDLPSKDRAKVRRDAQNWISSNRTGPFSFLWCADALEIDPIAIRRRVKGSRVNEW